MLSNRFNVLMAERRLTIKQIVKDTGLSRGTVSNVRNNPVANVSTQTLDTLCGYLDVTPTEFWVYKPD